MGVRSKTLTKHLSEYDRDLYAVEHKPPRVDVYRKSQLGCNPPNYLFSLTDTWTSSGKPIEYGIEVVMNRVKAHDLWRDDNFVEHWIKEHEQEEESKARDFRNSIEGFLYDFRRDFKKAFSDVNTSNMDKVYSKGA